MNFCIISSYQTSQKPYRYGQCKLLRQGYPSTNLQILCMALSLRFSMVASRRLLGDLIDPWCPFPPSGPSFFSSSSVTVIRIPPPLLPPACSPMPSEMEYLFSLLSIGDGLTRKSRREATMALDSVGNFTAILPKACQGREENLFLFCLIDIHLTG